MKESLANQNPIDILLVEDNPGDVRLTREALKEARIFNMLHIVEDGQTALDFLFKRGDRKNAVRPDLILLDWNLPGKSGKEVLIEIKRDSSLRKIPVIVLTSSSREKDIEDSYDLHANCFITKPVDLEQFIKVVCSVSDFWFSIVRRVPK